MIHIQTLFFFIALSSSLLLALIVLRLKSSGTECYSDGTGLCQHVGAAKNDVEKKKITSYKRKQ